MSSLFESYDLSGQRLSNRIVMAPMTRARVKDTVPSADMAIYYAQRAGAGLIITESAQVSAQGRGYLYTPGIHTPAQIEGCRGYSAGHRRLSTGREKCHDRGF
jgi:N-ethylmaleimide reductase